MATKEYKTVLVEKEDGITWVILTWVTARKSGTP